MRLEYEHLVQKPREQVWEALVDPEVLARILPGVEKFDAVGADEYDVIVNLGVPAVKGAFSGSIEIADQQFPARYALVPLCGWQPVTKLPITPEIVRGMIQAGS
jgi:hypothetical protein